MIEKTQVALIGAGPIGLEMAVELKKNKIPYIHIEKGQIAQTISWFPPMMRFFSSQERIAIAGMPIPRADQSKCSKEEYMAYLRSVALHYDLPIRTYTNVQKITPQKNGNFDIHCRDLWEQETQIQAEKVILATGDMHRPHKIGCPGEDQPHVTHYFQDPHRYFRQKVLVIGGKNSAVEAALRSWHCGAQVTIAHREKDFDPRHVKYWILPEIKGCFKRREIRNIPRVEPIRIEGRDITFKNLDTGEECTEQADFILLMVGYESDLALFRQAGLQLQGKEQRPLLDEKTMQATTPGLYIIGTATAGSQQSYSVFIETSHIHVHRVIASLQGTDPPADTETHLLPES